ncbi:MAG: S9 family peptidase, partial [Rhodoblastus sp.]
MPPFAKATQFEPPRAARHPVKHRRHDVESCDDYAWIRADNWRETLEDPDLLPKPIRALLEAENAYAASVLADVARLA